MVLHGFQEGVGGGSKVLHHHIALGAVDLLSLRRDGEAVTLVAEDCGSELVGGKGDQQRRGTSARRGRLPQAETLGNHVMDLRHCRNVTVGTSGTEAGLQIAVVNLLSEGVTSIRRFGLLVGDGDTKESHTEQLALLVPGVELLLEGEDVHLHRGDSGLENGDLGLEDIHLGLAGRQQSPRLVDGSRLLLEHIDD